MNAVVLRTLIRGRRAGEARGLQQINPFQYNIIDTVFLVLYYVYRYGTIGMHLSMVTLNVADPGCLSRILIFDHPGSRIQKQQQKRGVKKICCSTFFQFFVATKLTI